MGVKLFNVDISGIVAKKIGPGLPQATLIKVATAVREPGNQAGGTQPTATEYPCRGMEVSLDERFIDDTMVKRTDSAVMLIGDTISSGTVAPAAGDRVRIAGRTWAVVAVVDRDAARATYTLAVRGA